MRAKDTEPVIHPGHMDCVDDGLGPCDCPCHRVLEILGRLTYSGWLRMLEHAESIAAGGI